MHEGRDSFPWSQNAGYGDMAGIGERAGDYAEYVAEQHDHEDCKHELHFLQLFSPPGVPLWIAPLLIPIEIISYISRPITLSLRLFINMLAGHLMVKVIAGFSVMMIGAGTIGMFGSLGPMLFNVLLLGFELFVAFVQAYVFALLTCIYLRDTVELAH